MRKRFLWFALTAALLFTVTAQSTLTSPDAPISFGATGEAGLAEEEFRRGLQAFHRGAFNDSIRLLESALSYLPDEPLILDWLGNAYYRSGIEGMALTQWEYAAGSGYGGSMLQHKLDFLRSRRLVSASLADTRYTESGLFRGTIDKFMLFSQPVSVLPNPDGTFWAAAYSSSEVLKFDANGDILDRVRGPLAGGFAKPMDIARLKDGTLAVTEFFGDRISLIDPRGLYLRSFGTKGIGSGQVIGPQYLALDSSENLYVSDFGNARIVVFDKDFNGILEFTHAPMKAPTGIAILDDQVYVADAVSGAIYRFDRFGNYLDLVVPEKTLLHPEAMRAHQGQLLVADTNRVLAVDPELGTVFESARTGSAPARLTSAVPDVNGNVLAADFKSNEIYVLSRMDDLLGGLSVRVQRVISDNFPTVTLEVYVENLHREAVVGLKPVNFLITEDKRVAAVQELIGAASVNTDADITVIIDRSPVTTRYAAEVDSAVKEIAAALAVSAPGGTLRIVAAGATPLTEYTGPGAEGVRFAVDRLRTPVSDACKTDNAVRLAANDLVNAQQKRAIIYLTAGGLAPDAFDSYGLTDLCSYLNNNHISFYSINLSLEPLPEEIAYLTENTDGRDYYVYRPEGLAPLVTEIVEHPSGLYLFTYTSSLPTDFGRALLPVEVECYHLNQSGRGESAYFAPLQ